MERPKRCKDALDKVGGRPAFQAESGCGRPAFQAERGCSGYKRGPARKTQFTHSVAMQGLVLFQAKSYQEVSAQS